MDQDTAQGSAPYSLAEFGYNPVMLDLAAPPAGLAARALGAADIGACATLSAEAGWNQTERDWAFLLEIGHGAGLFAAPPEQRLVASAVALAYDAPAPDRRPIGFVSMVLVTPSWQRRGLATWLTGRCTRALEERGCTAMLDATPAGQGVYRRLGFAGGIALDRWRTESVAPLRAIERVPVPTDIGLIPLTDIEAIIVQDARAFGAGRRRVLQHLHARRPDLAWSARRGNALVGFVLGRDGCTATHVGPVIADDAATAAALLGQALRHVEGPAIVDLLRRQERVGALLAEAGFAAARGFTRMYRGLATRDGEPSTAALVAAIGPEFG